jgi:hypothetical protein
MPTEFYFDEDISEIKSEIDTLRLRMSNLEQRQTQLESRVMSRSGQEQPIAVWRFHEAPEGLRALSTHGGDEDWLAELPPSFDDDPPDWLYRLAASAGGDLILHNHPSKLGWKICIVAHA